MPSGSEGAGDTEGRGAFRTTATVVVPSFLSYCLVKSEAHYDALCDTYPSVGDALEASNGGPRRNHSSAPRAASTSVLLCDLDDDEYAVSLLEYRSFHLDFGPLTWMACTKLLAHLRATFARLSRSRGASAASRGSGNADGRGVAHEYAFEIPREKADGGDDHTTVNGGVSSPGDSPVMLLVVVRAYCGIEKATNLLTALGVMAVLSNSLSHPSQLFSLFPLDVAWQWTTAFHDASPYDDVEAYFDLTGADVVLAALKGFRLWGEEMLDTERFVVAHDYFQRMEHGDLSWIVPWQFAAFPSPADEAKSLAAVRPRTAGYGSSVAPDEDDDVALQMITKPASFYGSTFADPRGFYGCVHTVVQLNDNVQYQVSEFEDRGISHHALCFLDGSVPSDQVIAAFFRIVDQDHHVAASLQGSRPKTAVAVHCMAGLGRTGTLIALALMRDYGFSAKEAIGWCRLCRPGCIIGPQQQFLCWTEAQWKRLLFSAPIGVTTQTDHSRSTAEGTVDEDGGTVVYRNTAAHRSAFAATRPRGAELRAESAMPSHPRSTGADIDIDRSSLVEVVVNRVISSNASNASHAAGRPNRGMGSTATASTRTTARSDARREEMAVLPPSTLLPVTARRATAPTEMATTRVHDRLPTAEAFRGPARHDGGGESDAPQRRPPHSARASRRSTTLYTVGRSLSPASRRRRHQLDERQGARDDTDAVELPQGVQSWLDDNARWMRELRHTTTSTSGGGENANSRAVRTTTAAAAAPPPPAAAVVAVPASMPKPRPLSGGSLRPNSDVPVKTVLDALSSAAMSPHPSSPRVPTISRVSVVL